METKNVTLRGVYMKELHAKDSWRLFLALLDNGEKGQKEVKCSGVFMPMYEGQPFTFVGQFETYKGERVFRVESYTAELPKGVSETQSFIRSIRGIGVKRAKTISDYCDGDLSKLNGNDLDALCARCPGLKKENMERLLQRLSQIKMIGELQKTFGSVLTVEALGRIVTKFGNRSEHTLLYHPYWIDTIVGFGVADEVGAIDGFAANNPERLSSCVRITLNSLCRRNCSVMAKTAELIAEVIKRLEESKLGGASETDIRAAMNMVKDKGIIVRCGDYVYPKKNHDNEIAVAKFVVNQSKQMPMDRQQKYSKAFSQWCIEHRNMRLSAMQTKAVWEAGKNRVSVITGGPGTGKTTCLQAIIESYSAAFEDEPIMLLAPTGLAAKRMADKSGYPAKTIHSAFRLIPLDEMESGDADCDYNDMLVQSVESGLVIIDEFSMVSLDICAFIAKHVNFASNVQLVFVGDADQLPAVAAGNVLETLIATNVVPVTRLNRNYRQERNSGIPALAAAINGGDKAAIKMGGGCKFIRTDKKEICEKLKSEYVDAVAKYGVENVLVLMPMRKATDKTSDICTDKMNAILRDAINPAGRRKPELKVGDKVYRIGDRVINLKNSEFVVNGDIGTVMEISRNDGTMTVKMDCGTVVEYDTTKAAKMLDFAYAVTVHKAQGGEFDCILMPFAPGQEFMLTRKLVYTAITRARKEFVGIGGWTQFVGSAGRIQATTERKDFLGVRILKMISDKTGSSPKAA